MGHVLVLALGSVLLMADRVAEPGGAFVAQAAKASVIHARARTATIAPMQTEVFPLALFAISGMLVFPAAVDLPTLFVGLEVLSLPLYVMCGLARRRRLLSQEAAVKYFLLGAFASAILLYGIALLYGYSGSLRLADIALATQGGGRSNMLLLGGMALLVVGLLFKGSVGPFHTWTPDVYQGAPTPITAFMGACTKVAAFAAMIRVFYTAFAPSLWDWRGTLWAIAIASMLIGAILGITQTDVKRMLAYSSVAHAGFLLLGVMTLTLAGMSATFFYLLTYGFAIIGSLALAMLVRNADGEVGQISQWAGLARRSPMLAALMTLFLLSFAGIPLTSGFIAKLTLFSAATDAGMGPLVVVAMIATAITAFFYLQDRRADVLLRAAPGRPGRHRAEPDDARGDRDLRRGDARSRAVPVLRAGSVVRDDAAAVVGSTDVICTGRRRGHRARRRAARRAGGDRTERGGEPARP